MSGIDYLVKQDDFAEQGREFWIGQFRDKTTLSTLMGIWYSQITELQKLGIDILEGSTLRKAIGVQLDDIGSEVGVGRQDVDDEAYRARIMAAIFARSTFVDRDDIESLIETFTGDTQPIIFKRKANYVDVYINTDCFPTTNLGFLEKFFPLQTHLNLNRYEGTPFGFKDSETAGGFGWSTLGRVRQRNDGVGRFVWNDYHSEQDLGA